MFSILVLTFCYLPEEKLDKSFQVCLGGFSGWVLLFKAPVIKCLQIKCLLHDSCHGCLNARVFSPGCLRHSNKIRILTHAFIYRVALWVALLSPSLGVIGSLLSSGTDWGKHRHGENIERNSTQCSPCSFQLPRTCWYVNWPEVWMNV